MVGLRQYQSTYSEERFVVNQGAALFRDNLELRRGHQLNFSLKLPEAEDKMRISIKE